MSKHHKVAYAQKRTKRNKQKHWNRINLLRIEAKERKAEAKKEQDKALKKGLIKLEVIPKKQKSPQKKGKKRNDHDKQRRFIKV